MRFIEVGGARLSVIGLGTWQFGSREWGYGSEYAEKDAVEITQRALDLGINLIDTAEIYAFGKSERIVGRAIKSRRAEAFVATKLLPVMPLAPIVEQRGRASAARLGVDQIDLYQLHWPNPAVPLATTMKGMANLVDQGIVRHVGVSNYNLKQWRDAERLLGGAVLSNQVQYSLVRRKPERELLGFARDEGRVVIAYSPLAQGFLSGRYDGTNTPGGVRAGNSLFLKHNIEQAKPLLDALREIAAAHGATPAQIALAWVIRRPNVIAIPGASSVAQLEKNAAAADLELSSDEDARLTELSDRFEPIGGVKAWPDLIRARIGR